MTLTESCLPRDQRFALIRQRITDRTRRYDGLSDHSIRRALCGGAETALRQAAARGELAALLQDILDNETIVIDDGTF